MKISNLLNLLGKKASKIQTFIFLLSLTAISFAFLNVPLNSNAASPVTRLALDCFCFARNEYRLKIAIAKRHCVIAVSTSPLARLLG